MEKNTILSGIGEKIKLKFRNTQRKCLFETKYECKCYRIFPKPEQATTQNGRNEKLVWMLCVEVY